MSTQIPQSLIAPYLKSLEQKFDRIAKAVEDVRISSDAAADIALAEPSLRRQFLDEIAPHLLEEVILFWRDNEVRMLEAVRSLPGLKATFGGDIGPQRAFRQLERAGLYFDTVVVQDPLLRVARMPGPLLANEKARLLIKYSLELVWARDLYLAELQPPVAVLIPDREIGGFRGQFDERWIETEPWALLYWNRLLGREFKAFAEFLEYINGLGTTRAVLDSMEHAELFRLDADADPDPHSQWAAHLEQTRNRFDIPETDDLDHPGFLLNSVRGRLMIANDILNTAATYAGHPLVGAPISYHYTSWRGTALADDVSAAVGNDLGGSLVQTNSLLAKGLDWLGNVSAENLIKLRSRGRLEEMRSLLRVEAGRLQGVSLDDVEKVSREVDHHLEQGFRRHEDEVAGKDTAFKTELAIEGAGLIISAAVAMQPMLVPAAPVWLTPVIGVVGVGSTVKDLVKRISERVRETRRLSSAPIAILLEAKDKAKR